MIKQDVVIAVLKAIPDLQPFTVTFIKANGESRILTCHRDGGKELTMDSHICTVATDKGPKSFKTNSVLRISIP